MYGAYLALRGTSFPSAHLAHPAFGKQKCTHTPFLRKMGYVQCAVLLGIDPT